MYVTKHDNLTNTTYLIANSYISIVSLPLIQKYMTTNANHTIVIDNTVSHGTNAPNRYLIITKVEPNQPTQLDNINIKSQNKLDAQHKRNLDAFWADDDNQSMLHRGILTKAEINAIKNNEYKE